MILSCFAVDGYSQEKSNIPEKPVVQQTPTAKELYINPHFKHRGLIVIADLNVTPLAYTGSCPAVFTLKGQIHANKPMTVFYKIIRSDNVPMKPISLTFEKEERKEITHTLQIGDPTKSPVINEWAMIEVVYPINTKIRSNAAFIRGNCTNRADLKQQGLLSEQESKKGQPTAPIDIPSISPSQGDQGPGISTPQVDEKGRAPVGSVASPTNGK